jgi:imidazolonepropionase-like amidohydrolase
MLFNASERKTENKDMSILIKCGRLIDGRGGVPVDNASILVEGERISEVGRTTEIKAPPGATVIDLTPSTVLPGLMDAHTHLMQQFGEDPNEKYPQPELYEMLKSVRNMRWDLRCGITTIRNPGERSWRAVPIRHAIEKGIIPGPRILTGLRGIRPTHGWGQNAFAFDGVDSLRRAIRENVEAGADLIKIYVSGSHFAGNGTKCYMTPEEIRVCTDEAHRVGLPVVVHCHGGAGVRYCVEAGVNTIEHLTMMNEEDIELFLKHGTILVATFNPYFHESTLAGRPPEVAAKVIQAQENMRKVFPKAFKSGIKFTVGTDSRHGNFVFELEMLVQMGLTAMQAISACTRNAAETLGILEKTGTLEPGKLADIIGIPENPLENISRLRDVNFVMKAGVHYNLSQL